MSHPLKRCTECQNPINGYEYLRCCQKIAHVCRTCSFKACKICRAKNDKVIRSPKKQHYELYTSKKTKKCGRCQATFMEYQQPFLEKHCGKNFCFKCMFEFYDHYLGVVEELQGSQKNKIEMPVEIHCGCQYTENQLIEYFRKSCYVCKKRLREKHYQMTNHMRVEKGCYEMIKSKGEKTLTLSIDRENWKTMDKLVAKCDSCTRPFSDVGNQIGDLFICKTCHRVMEEAESQYIEKKEKQLELEMKRNPKKKCQRCTQFFIRKNKDETICQQCILSAKILEKKQKEDKKKREEQLQRRQFEKKEPNKIEGKKIEESKELNKLESKDINLKKNEKVQNKNDYQNKQPEKGKERIHSIQKIQIPAEYIQPDVKQYKLTIKMEKQNKLIQCSQCLILIEQEDAYITFYRDPKDKSTIRIIENQEELQKQKKEGKTNIFCQQCYLEVKVNLHEQKILKKKEKQYENKYSRSVPKHEKRFNEYQDKTNLFTTSTKPNFYNEPYEQNPIIARRLHQTVVKKRCKDCFTQIEVDLSKPSLELCELCRRKKGVEGEICKMCGTRKKELKTPPYCKECWDVKLRR